MRTCWRWRPPIYFTSYATILSSTVIKGRGVVAALVFLALNGIEVDAEKAEFETLVRGIAEGRFGKDKVARFFNINK
jgi:hypothetical protein